MVLSSRMCAVGVSYAASMPVVWDRILIIGNNYAYINQQRTPE